MRHFIAFLASMVLAGCSSSAASLGQDSAGPNGTAQSASRDFALSGFDTVVLHGPDNAQIRIGDQFSVRAEGPVAVLDILDITVEDGVLEIHRQNDVDYSRREYRGHVNVFVTMPVVRGVAISGSGDMSVESGEGEEFNAAVSGSGDMSIGTVTANTGRFAISGSGDIAASGTARDIEAVISGSGDMAFADLRAETLRAAIRGSGDIDAYVTGSVEASFAGSGGVRARGGAECRSSGTGSGQVICTD